MYPIVYVLSASLRRALSSPVCHCSHPVLTNNSDSSDHLMKSTCTGVGALPQNLHLLSWQMAVLMCSGVDSEHFQKRRGGAIPSLVKVKQLWEPVSRKKNCKRSQPESSPYFSNQPPLWKTEKGLPRPKNNTKKPCKIPSSMCLYPHPIYSADVLSLLANGSEHCWLWLATG